MASSIKVFIVDDSAVVRKVIAEVLSRDPAIALLGSAPDPIFAQRKMEREWPDVILLDIEMPRMDGITFLKKLMRERPTPVVICSTLTEKGATKSIEALSAGAVEVIAKPRLALRDFPSESSAALVSAVKAAARAQVSKPPGLKGVGSPAAARYSPSAKVANRVVALGTSTGGTQALETVLRELPESCPGVVVVQHMPEKFTAAFAERLNKCCRCEVREAANGDKVRTGAVLIAPGARHMQLRRGGDGYTVEIKDGPPVSRHKPSVDVLFRSVAKSAGRRAVGIIMTGMGNDGASGLLEMH